MTQIPDNLPTVIKSVAPFINHYGYFAVASLVMVEDFGIPVPGETTLITAALFSSIGHLNIFLVIIVGILAAIIGDNIGFVIGDFGGRPLIERIGKYVFITKERLDKAESFFNRHGGRVVIVARFIEGLRQANGIIAGISDMKWKKFIFYNSIGAFLWVATWSSVGYFGGSHIGLFLKYELKISIIFVTLLLLFIGWKIYKNLNRKSKLAK